MQPLETRTFGIIVKVGLVGVHILKNPNGESIRRKAERMGHITRASEAHTQICLLAQAAQKLCYLVCFTVARKNEKCDERAFFVVVVELIAFVLEVPLLGVTQ